ncbi:MAG: diadenylate cyclase CdaA [Clostridia bacterium]|nr:diadenylate cyclase CdaA [Clostridia bacterium]
MEAINNLLEMIGRSFMKMGILDLLDIFLVSLLIYWAISFIKERRAGKLALGLAVIILLKLIASLLNLTTVNYILQNIFQVGIIAIIIIFQPEIRDLLERMGGVKKLITSTRDDSQLDSTIRNVCEAVIDMSSDLTGALIVFERSTGLEDYVVSGTVINSDVSKNVIKNIFFTKAPLHDGAVIIKNNRLYSAGCKLPLANVSDKDFGTRHRAAIGMSEKSDAVVVVVSEETGTISLAVNGQLKRNYDYARLYSELTELLTAKAIQNIVSDKIPKERLFKKKSDGSENDTENED